MKLLEYQIKPVIDPRIYPAATHLLVWTILCWIICSLLFCATLLSLIGFVSTGLPGRLNKEGIGILAVPAILISALLMLFWFRLALRVRYLRQLLLVQDWSALAGAIFVFNRLVFYARPIAAIALIICIAELEGAHFPTILVCGTAVVFSASAVFGLLWTRRVLRRAHTAASVSTQSQLTFS